MPISSSVVPFSSCPQSLPASESFPISQLLAWGGQSTRVSALASFLPKNKSVLWYKLPGLWSIMYFWWGQQMWRLRLILQQNIFKSVYIIPTAKSYFSKNHVDFEVRDGPQRSSLYWRKGMWGLWNCWKRKTKVLIWRTAVSLSKSLRGRQVKHLGLQSGFLGLNFSSTTCQLSSLRQIMSQFPHL